MGALAPYIWLTLFCLMTLKALALLFVPRDFSGNDGCADDRKWPIVS